jgi:hypothetical protein
MSVTTRAAQPGVGTSAERAMTVSSDSHEVVFSFSLGPPGHSVPSVSPGSARPKVVTGQRVSAHNLTTAWARTYNATGGANPLCRGSVWRVSPPTTKG